MSIILREWINIVTEERQANLDEAPIGDLEVHNMDYPGTFPDADRKLMNNPAHIKQVRHAFAKTKFNFDLYFVNQPGESYLDYEQEVLDSKGGTSPAFNQNFEDDVESFAGVHDNGARLKQRLGISVEPKPGIITVVYLSNANVETTIPMTPWIIAHRFGHAITDENIKFGRFADTVGRITAFASMRHGRDRLKQNMTMRSARSGNLADSDYVEELIAQYLINGRVTFRDESLNWIGELMLKLLQACVGKLFVTV